MQETDILKWEDSITFPARDKSLDPQEFFKRSGIYLSDFFRHCVLPTLKPIARTPKRVYGVGYLKIATYDDKIRPGLPKRHLGNWEDIASFIEMYPKGKKGHYFLYMEGSGGEVIVISIRWSSECADWDINGYRFGDNYRGYWPAGNHALCPDPDNEVS